MHQIVTSFINIFTTITSLPLLRSHDPGPQHGLNQVQVDLLDPGDRHLDDLGHGVHLGHHQPVLDYIGEYFAYQNFGKILTQTSKLY